VVEVVEFIESFFEAVLLLKVFEDFVGELESDDGVGSAVLVKGAVDDEFAGLKDEVLEVIIALHNCEWGKMMSKEGRQANIETPFSLFWNKIPLKNFVGW